MRTYTAISAFTLDGQSILTSPTFGQYHSRFPQDAAGKAYTNIMKYVSKYNDWFPTIKKNDPLIIVLQEIGETQPRIYYVFREKAVQSLSKPRTIRSFGHGKEVSFNWRNRAVPMREGESPEEAMERYSIRRTIAQDRYHF